MVLDYTVRLDFNYGSLKLDLHRYCMNLILVKRVKKFSFCFIGIKKLIPNNLDPYNRTIKKFAPSTLSEISTVLEQYDRLEMDRTVGT